MKKKLVLLGFVSAILVIAVFASIHFIRINKYTSDSSYCEKSEDCQCYNCGCFNHFRGDFECFLEKEGTECQTKGCQCINNECQVLIIPEEAIDTAQEAIDYAKQDEEFNNFMKIGNVGYNAYFDEELGMWQVVAYKKDASDLDYQINFYPNGTVTFKGGVPI